MGWKTHIPPSTLPDFSCPPVARVSSKETKHPFCYFLALGKRASGFEIESNMASPIVIVSSEQSALPQVMSSNTTQWQDALPWSNLTAGWSTWQYTVTFLLGIVVYDQGKLNGELR